MLKPETIATLRDTVPEFRELVSFFKDELHALDTLEGLSNLTFSERAYEVTGRLRAKEKLQEMLAPLLADFEPGGSIDPKEFTVEVP